MQACVHIDRKHAYERDIQHIRRPCFARCSISVFRTTNSSHARFCRTVMLVFPASASREPAFPHNTLSHATIRFASSPFFRYRKQTSGQPAYIEEDDEEEEEEEEERNRDRERGRQPASRDVSKRARVPPLCVVYVLEAFISLVVLGCLLGGTLAMVSFVDWFCTPVFWVHFLYRVIFCMVVCIGCRADHQLARSWYLCML